jgi:hypothetical protein
VRKLLAIALCVLAGLVCAQAQASEPKYAELERVASIFAMQPVTLECSTPAEDYNLYDAWGYVYLIFPVIHMGDYLCDAAAEIGQHGAGVTALAILVLTHEALHLRKQWSARGDEAKVECKAIRHFRVAAQMLGYTAEQATNLRAYALAFHWKLAARIPEYHLSGCQVPRP